MSELNRRTVLTRSAAVLGGAAVAGSLAGPTGAAAQVDAPPNGATVLPDDPRYPLLTTGNNQRFVARPGYVRMIRSTQDAEAALRDAVRAGKRVTARSGGHCFADFVCNPDVEVILDFSEMTEVGYDAERLAFTVEPGARLLNV
jgi:FAD/FMN-containing dehydrogenase